MAEKAELDILEVDLQDAAGDPGVEPPPEDQGDRGADRKALLRKGLLVLLVVLLCGAGIASWFYFGPDGAGDAGKKRSGAAVLPGDRFMSLEHFAVNLKDGQGNYRVLVCDVVLELSRGPAAADRSLELRKIIYRTVRTNGAPILQKSAKIRKQLLKEIEKNINSALGEGAVRHVYFTKYILL